MDFLVTFSIQHENTVEDALLSWKLTFPILTGSSKKKNFLSNMERKYKFELVL